MWKRIAKEKSKAPVKGNYSDWKDRLSIEGYHQCVYCYIDEVYMGGIRHFHVEHYKPKSKFPLLINAYSNLFYVCPICNTFKSNDWPNEPDFDYSKAFYPNPSLVDYSSLLSVNDSTFFVEGDTFTAKYIIEKLFLNRNQLVNYRREMFINERISEQRKLLEENLRKIKDKSVKNGIVCDIFMESVEILGKIVDIQCDRKRLILYRGQDITKL